MSDILPVYIGYDEREDAAYRVCRYSISRHSSLPVYHMPLDQRTLRYTGLFDRPAWVDGKTRIDGRDGKPFSTDFSFTRFLVPMLAQYRGWALFCDCDFLFTRDIAELFALAEPDKAVMVVKHEHVPVEREKMDGIPQTVYRRKNWSSLVLWNCEHPSNKRLTVESVNRQPGSWLHAFEWLKDDEIGALPLSWNWLSGVSEPTDPTPAAIHYTLGGPWFPDWQRVPYADLWREESRHMLGKTLERAA